MADAPSVIVVGSVNLDIVATVDKLPVAGETVTGAELNRFPGGKGANQALAAKRLGADVSLLACVGDDPDADLALSLLVAAEVDLSRCLTSAASSTGVALIAVSAAGENQIVVAPGANGDLVAEKPDLPPADALLCQLEVPVDTLEACVREFGGLVCLNLAPAMPVPEALVRRADLIVVNETEAAFYGSLVGEVGGIVATTFGAEGAQISKAGKVVASVKPPVIAAVDSTGAGDAFTAALTLAMIEGQDWQEALAFACAAGAAAAAKPGAQPSLPLRHEVEALLAQ